MTESVRAAKRRVGADRAPTEADSGPAVPHRHAPVPIAGLAFASSLDGYERLGGPVARPGSVVEALRRQAIRRSTRDVVMDLGSDSEDESDEEMTAEEAANDIVVWLRAKAGKGTNYTVAVCDDEIYISKVNGVTATTKMMQDLKVYIEAEGIGDLFNIYLCRTYNTSQPSNHAEMCVVAAIGKAKFRSITFLECTAASCDYCAAFLAHYKVPNSSPENDPASQAGWTHPFAPVAWGTQLGDHNAQVDELKAYLKDPDTDLEIGMKITTKPAGRRDHWI
jgi:hypothetical protein